MSCKFIVMLSLAVLVFAESNRSKGAARHCSKMILALNVFYKTMLSQRLSPPAAIRAAQIAILSEKAWPQPYYWAAFTFYGEWK